MMDSWIGFGLTTLSAGCMLDSEGRVYRLGLMVLTLTASSVLHLVTPQVMRNEGNYCQFDTFSAGCERGHVIRMEHALYGRMSVGPCVKEMSALGCSESVLLYTDSQCSGRQTCSIRVSDISVQGIRPCQKDYTSYLQASFSCLKVAMRDYHECRTSKVLKVPPGGYISNTVNQGSGLSATCPWRIQASPGQRINITLLDFSVYKVNGSHSSQPMAFCRKYAVISEGSGREESICGSDKRERVAYISHGHTVDISLYDYTSSQNAKGRVYFVFRHEAIGCPSLTTPAHAEVTRSGESVTITCKLTGEKWHMRCHKNTWIGIMGNCSTAVDATIWGALTEEWSSPMGIVIVVGLGVGLGIIIGVCLLVSVLFFLKRRRWLHRREAAGVDRGNDDDDVIQPQVQMEGRVAMGMMALPDETYAPNTWLSQRPLPLPFIEEDLKRVNKELQDTFILRQDNGATITTVGKHPHRAGHIYESPKFGRKELMTHSQS